MNGLVKLAVAAAFVVGIFGVLIYTNMITLSKFQTVSVSDSSGTQYMLQFYTNHTTKALSSGNTQLVSHVSENGKFPISLSINPGTADGYSRVKDCSGFTKVFDVTNSSLNQTISVCNFPSGVQNLPNSVFVAGISSGGKLSIITISQNVSQADAAKVGLDTYQSDIQHIVSSIKEQ